MPTLGLSLIVKNEAHNLEACIQSAKAVVSEIVVADTGSTDGSQEIARACGAQVIEIPWENDFAKARNASLQRVNTDWVLVLDADEELDSEAYRFLPGLMRRSGVGGYAVPVRNYLSARHGNVNGNRAQANDGRSERARTAPSFATHPVLRLFRRSPKIFYTGCIHEVVAPQIVSAGFKLSPCNLIIHHFGYLDAQDRQREKSEFYLGLLRAKVEREPANAFGWVELARQLSDPFERHEEAAKAAERALMLNPSLAEGWLALGIALLKLNRGAEALAALDRAAVVPELAVECEHHRGDALHDMGRLDEACAAYGKALARGEDPQLESKLGYAEVRLGRVASGLEHLRAALRALPLGAELHDRLIKACVAANRLPEAADAAEQFAHTVAHPRTILRAAALCAHLQQQERALKLVAEGIQLFPEAPELRAAWSELGGR